MAERYEHRAILLGSGDPESGGGGSTVATLLQASAVGILPVEFVGIVCNNSEQKVPGFYEKIEDHNEQYGADIPIYTINGARYQATDGEIVEKGEQHAAEAQACIDVMDNHGADFYVAAGWMKKISGALLDRNGLNTHPGPLYPEGGMPEGLLPGIEGVDTKGLHGVHVQEVVLENGFPYSAHTSHEVIEEYDSGRIIGWRPVLVKPNDTPDTLFERVQIAEKAGLIEDILKFALM